MENGERDDFLNSEGIRSFLSEAKGFCSAIETSRLDEDLIQILRKSLASLYHSALSLPSLDAGSEEISEDLFSENEFKDIILKIENIVGEKRYYSAMFDPTDHEEECPVTGDLVEDIGEVYKNLKNGLLLYEIGSKEATHNAIWELKFGFKSHWGNNLIDALRTFHYLNQKY